MDLSVAREIDGPAVIADEVGGETLVVNLNSGSYYVIPPSSQLVWSALAGGVPAEQLLAGPEDPRTEALITYVTELVEAGLLREAQSAQPAQPVDWTADDLVIEPHDDMADLLGLDPIHDADANVGWPMRAPG